VFVVHCPRRYLEAGGLTLALVRGGMPALLIARVRSRKTKSAQNARETRTAQIEKVRSITTYHAAERSKTQQTGGVETQPMAAAADIDLSQFLTKAEAAERAQRTPGTIVRWCQQGYLTRYGGPGKLFIDPAELQKLLEQGPRRKRPPSK
jgi:hypothetical protein